MDQWLRLRAPNAGGPGLIPGQGTRSRMPQLGAHVPQLKIPHAATKIPRATTKTQHRQINKYFFKKKELKLSLLSVALFFNIYETSSPFLFFLNYFSFF